MYGVVEIGGHQYKVQAGDLIDVEKLTNEEGQDVTFENVLFVGGKTPLVGKPLVKGAQVTAKVLRHDRSRKLIIFKRKPGGRHVKNGFRKHYTALLVTELNDGNGNVDKIKADSKAGLKYLK